MVSSRDNREPQNPCKGCPDSSFWCRQVMGCERLGRFFDYYEEKIRIEQNTRLGYIYGDNLRTRLQT